MRRLLVAVLVMLVLSVDPRAAVGCSCVPFSRTQMVDNASVIFTGTVTGFSRIFGFTQACSRSSDEPITFFFDVETVFRGDVPRKASVETVASGASCGYEFAGGKRYTVFATGAVDHLTTNLCRGNVEGTIDLSGYGLNGVPPHP